ncbi:hypothetical protein T265_09368 [Opisthorchis viverrini]|uniref:Uncharacterized protein n=1 Tax=Opisthorchis viverrini TaxID=6198 RepID=A0A074ZH71_OPIVI|nr:hypothetical protein T265_09368 [Opisthorchis viverrini]KER22570.1 hypothetical protein T265_09368 [Opisthorchis viverrini]
MMDALSDKHFRLPIMQQLDPNDKLGSIVPEEDEVLFAKIATKVRQDFCLDLFSVDVIECVEQGANTKNAEDVCEGRKQRKFAVIDVNPLPSELLITP